MTGTRSMTRPFRSQVSVQTSTRPGTVDVSASNSEAVIVPAVARPTRTAVLMPQTARRRMERIGASLRSRLEQRVCRPNERTVRRSRAVT
jgi:hypothetical protein